VKYQGRVAVVTGAGSGIGRALTYALTQDGAHVAASDIDNANLAETQALCRSGQVTTYQVDVADRDAVCGYAEDVRRDLGPASMVFNNAGVDLFASVADMSWKDFDWLVGINIGGVVNGTKAFPPQLIESGAAQRPARLINLSSAFGLIAVPYQSAYSTSKFAVRGFTEALRQEMTIERHPVTVHCVHPGVVRTNFGTNMRTGRPRIPKSQRSTFNVRHSPLLRRPPGSFSGEPTETAPESSLGPTGAPWQRCLVFSVRDTPAFWPAPRDWRTSVRPASRVGDRP
jgi:NAD(P)-dependent dehydrogenase (short-subunit alcohol dehydrogenase family)